MRRRFFGALAALLLALALSPAALAAVAPQPGRVLPPFGTSGTRFVFIADGFQAGERLSTWANTPDGRVLPYDADVPDKAQPGGSVSWNWVAPDGFQPGTWQFVVHGLTSGIERVFTVGINAPEAVTPSAQYNVQPAAGHPGDIFHFYAIGFTEGEQVFARVVAPNGTSSTDGLQIDGKAQAGGRVDGTWTAPLDVSAYGTWKIVVHGHESGVDREIPLTLEPVAAAGRPAPRVSPAVGRPGMLFIFNVAGFQPDEPLSAWVNTADRRIVAVDDQAFRPTGEGISAHWIWDAGRDGSVNFGWTAPADAAPGTWSMVVHGRTSGVEQVISFQILAAE